MSWPPRIGEPLPRAEEAWHESIKLDAWVLAKHRHVKAARVIVVRDRGADGIICGVEVELTLNERTAVVTTSWHYANDAAAPRLVTAYITL